ncbi:MAG: Holliday junction branch migration protein RuvA [Chloroflexi bacterium]|nr:Holliday junction branch migration protein RuvA [Chloroflexota bacterium]
MIASLCGKLTAVGDDYVVVDVGGVGFRVRTTQSLIEHATPGKTVELQTHMIVRENEISLYGFQSTEEVDLFGVLIGVSGIGPRTALSILSAFSPETLRGVISQGDVQALTRIPGIGRKTAQRLALDLKDRLGVGGAGVALSSVNASDADALNALTALGYSLSEAQEALSLVPADVQGLDERILAALRALGSR